MAVAPVKSPERTDPMWAGLLVVACLVRLLYVLKISPNAIHGDQDDYLEGARRLLDGRPLPFRNVLLFVRPPGFSIFIACLWKLTGTQSLAIIKVAQALVGTATCWYAGQMARLLVQDRVVRLLAVAGAAFYPYFIYYTAFVGTETLSTFFVAAGTYHLAKGMRETPLVPELLIGSLLLSFGNLVRAHVTVLWPLVGLWVVWRYRSRPKRIIAIGAALAVPLLAVSLPWTVAVARQNLGTMFVTDGAGVYYYMGHNDAVEQIFCEDIDAARERQLINYGAWITREPAFLAAMAAPSGRQSSTFLEAGLAWDRAHADKLPCLMRSKLWGYWRPYVNPVTYGRMTVVVSFVALPLMLLAGFGFFIAWRTGERAITVLVALEALAGTASAMIFSTEIRYRIQAVDIFLIVFAAHALGVLLRRRASHRHG